MILRSLNSQQKNSFYALVSLCLPVEFRHESTLPESSYSQEFLHFLINEMDMTSNYYDAYSTLVKKEYYQNNDEKDKKLSMIKPFIQVLQLQSDQTEIELFTPIICLIITLILQNRYNSKSRSMIRQLINHFIDQLTLEESTVAVSVLSLEQHIIKMLQEVYNHGADKTTITHSQKEKSMKSKYIRYAQIGAVGIGAGAILALTGGMYVRVKMCRWFDLVNKLHVYTSLK